MCKRGAKTLVLESRNTDLRIRNTGRAPILFRLCPTQLNGRNSARCVVSYASTCYSVGPTCQYTYAISSDSIDCCMGMRRRCRCRCRVLPHRNGSGYHKRRSRIHQSTFGSRQNYRRVDARRGLLAWRYRCCERHHYVPHTRAFGSCERRPGRFRFSGDRGRGHLRRADFRSLRRRLGTGRGIVSALSAVGHTVGNGAYMFSSSPPGTRAAPGTLTHSYVQASIHRQSLRSWYYANALRPVRSCPTTSVCTSCVPS